MKISIENKVFTIVILKGLVLLSLKLFGLHLVMTKINTYGWEFTGNWYRKKMVNGKTRNIIIWHRKINFGDEPLSFIKYSIQEWAYEKAIFFIDAITLRDVYYWYSATDCDHYHVEYPVKYKHIFEAKKAIEREYDNAEGAMSFFRMTRKEYEEEKNNHISRDYALEAFENGHPYNVRG